MRLLVDIDGTIADYESRFLDLWRLKHPEKEFIPIAKRKAFDVAEDLKPTYKQFVYEIKQAPGFFEYMKPIAGAKNALTEMASLHLTVFLCTKCISYYPNCVLEKYYWVERELGVEWIQKIIITGNKTIVDGDYLIDDSPWVSGVEESPRWEHLIFDQPYNWHVTDRRRLNWKNWKKIILSL